MNVTLLVLSGVSIIIILVLIFLPKYQTNSLANNSNQIEIENLKNELRKSYIQLAGGLFLIIGVIFSYQDLLLTKLNNNNAQFDKIVELLGNDKNYIKIGAIYSLREFSSANNEYSTISLDILSSYYKDIAKWKDTDLNQSNFELFQSLLYVISDLRNHDDRQLDISNTDFRNLVLSSIKLNNTKIINSHFESADLKNAKFDNSILIGSSFDSANLENVSFKNSDLSYSSFKKTNIKNVDFSGAKLSGIEGYSSEEIKKYAITDNKTQF